MFSGGSDYIMIAEAVFAGANIISINVTVLDDGLVELPESFFLTGLVVEEDVPVIFGDHLEVSVISDEGKFKTRWFGVCGVCTSLLHMHVSIVIYNTVYTLYICIVSVIT